MERGNMSFLCIFAQPPPRQWLQVTLTNPRGTPRDLLLTCTFPSVPFKL